MENIFGYPLYISEFGTLCKDISGYKLEKSDEWDAKCKISAFCKNDNISNVICKNTLHDHTKNMLNMLGIQNLDLTFNLCGDPSCNVCSDVWINEYEYGDYQDSHTHDDENRKILFSFVYFSKYNKDTDANIVFENIAPRHAVCEEMENVYPFFSGIELDVNQGDIIIFPSWLEHSVDKHENKNDSRITIAGNLYKVGENKCNKKIHKQRDVIYKTETGQDVIFTKNDCVIASYIGWDEVMNKISNECENRTLLTIHKDNAHPTLVTHNDYYKGNIHKTINNVKKYYNFKNMHMYISFGKHSTTFRRHNDDVDVLIVQSIGKTSYKFDNGYVCELKPGDSLFIPKGVYHEPIVTEQRVSLSFGF
jgi:mannose-6-phosphate isomerase-like protein (cupin superfamily)